MSFKDCHFSEDNKTLPLVTAHIKATYDYHEYRGLFGGWRQILTAGVPKMWDSYKSHVLCQTATTAVSLGFTAPSLLAMSYQCPNSKYCIKLKHHPQKQYIIGCQRVGDKQQKKPIMFLAHLGL